MMGRSTRGGRTRPIGHQSPPQLQPRQVLVERRRRSRSRRRGARAAAGLVLLPARLCCLLAMLLIVLFGGGRRGVEAFAPAPALSTGGPCCRPSVDGRSDARGLLAMKKEEGGGAKKPIKRFCATNKYAKSSYEIGKKFEAGISLVGTEIAPIVSGSCQLRDAYCRVKDGELWIFNLFVGPHKTTGKYFQHQEKRARRLLVHKKEILELRNAAEREGQTIVPLRIYLNGDHRIKVEIAIGRGVKKYDKREAIKEREMKRGFERILKAF